MLLDFSSTRNIRAALLLYKHRVTAFNGISSLLRSSCACSSERQFLRAAAAIGLFRESL